MNMKLFKFSAFTMSILLTATLITGCISSNPEKDINVSTVIKASDKSKLPSISKQRTDNVVAAIGKPSGIFNPLYASSADDININDLIFDSLVEFDADGNPIDGISDYKVSNDNLVYTFDLKKATFTNGAQLTADDVIFTITLMLDSSFSGLYDMKQFNIKGAEDYTNAKAKTVTGLKKIDNDTVEITLNKANSSFIYNLDFGILCKAYYSKGYVQGNEKSIYSFDSKPLGTGQYSLVKYDPAGVVELKANPNYFKGAPKISKLTLSSTAVGDEVLKLKNGDVDFAIVPATNDYLTTAEKAKFIDIYRYPSNLFGTAVFNCNNTFIKDKAVRQAIAYATNREGVVSQVFGDFGEVISIPESKMSWAYTNENINHYDFNLDKAKQMLASAGFKKNADGILEKDGKKLEITFAAESPNEVTDVLLPVMQSDLKKIGVVMNIQNVDQATMIDLFTKGKADIMFFALGLTADPSAISALVKSDGGMNFAGYANKEVDAAYDKAAIQTKLEDRKQSYAKAYQILNADLPYMPIYQRDDLFLISSKLENVTVSPYRTIFADMYKVEILK